MGLHSIFHSQIFPVHITEYERYFNPSVPLDVFPSLIALGPSGRANATSSRSTRVNFPAPCHFHSHFGSGMLNYTDWEQYENVTTQRVVAKYKYINIIRSEFAARVCINVTASLGRKSNNNCRGCLLMRFFRGKSIHMERCWKKTGIL